jgi:succinoglycan biosynthesis transport protein ExoP
MPEVLDEQKSEPFDMQRYLDLGRRRYPYFLISLLLGWLVVWGVSWVLPVSYRSSTLILVEQPTMPRDYVVSNINEDLQDRIQNISQQILSRTRLLHIIDQLNLYGGSRSKLTPDEKAARMRKDIDIELVRDARNNEITAFKIYYSARDPHIAQQVTSELTSLFINENLEVRQQQSEDTTRFLESQLEDARQSLAAQDAKIRAFKGEHVGDLPTQQASNLQILSGLQSQLGNEQDALNTAQQQRVYLETLISQYRSLPAPSRTTPDGVPAGLPAIDQQLAKLKSQLATLSSQYTDQHPDIRSLKVEIAKTERMRSELSAELKNKNNGGSQSEKGAAAADPADVAQNAPILQLESQLQANKTEIVNRQQSIAGLQVKINDYQARLNDEPVREQQLADLTRGYDQSKANYDGLLKKEIESKMATSMEQMQKGERFRMIDPPSLPLKPDSPDRLRFSGMGLGLGLALGLAVAGGLEFIDDRLHSEKQLKALLPMKVISEIPDVLTASDEQKNKQRVWFAWAMTAVVFMTIAAGSLLSYRHS